MNPLQRVLAVALAAFSAITFATGQGIATTPQLLTVLKVGSGHGTVTSDVSGIDCGATCVSAFPQDTPVTLTANPTASSTFVGWSGDCSGTAPCPLLMSGQHVVTANFAETARPDAWIKLCGLSDGCTIDPLPHPWKGKDVYNSTGAKQTISVKMEDGEGVRFWILLENDGALEDTITVEGCKGTNKFKINKVQVGFYKRPTSGSEKITDQFKAGTAHFDLNGRNQSREVTKLTLNIIAPTTAEGVTYRCDIVFRSDLDGSVVDTLTAEMTTY